MATLTEQASKGQKKAMRALYEQYKQKVNSFCTLLLDDKSKADDAAPEIFSGIWAKLRNKGAFEEVEFERLAMITAAKYCKGLLLKNDEKVFKNMKNANISRELTSGADVCEDFNGDANAAYESLNKALNNLSKQQRLVLVMAFGGNMSMKDIGAVCNLYEAAAKTYYEAAVVNLSEEINKSGDGIVLKISQLKSLFEKVTEANSLSREADARCLESIEKNAVKKEKNDQSKKALIIGIAVSLFVVIIGIVIAMTIGGTENNNTYTTGTDSDKGVASGDESSAFDTTGTYIPEELDESLTYYADIEIQDYGTITVKLDQKSAPISAANFVELAQSGFYDGLTFHRIIEGFMMQGGDPEGTGMGGSKNNIAGEFSSNGFTNNLSHTKGAISMARSSAKNSASSQFFIVHEDSTYLDGDYAVFGYVTEGMDVVDAVCTEAEPTDNNGTIPADSQPVITSIKIRTE